MKRILKKILIAFAVGFIGFFYRPIIYKHISDFMHLFGITGDLNKGVTFGTLSVLIMLLTELITFIIDDISSGGNSSYHYIEEELKKKEFFKNNLEELVSNVKKSTPDISENEENDKNISSSSEVVGEEESLENSDENILERKIKECEEEEKNMVNKLKEEIKLRKELESDVDSIIDILNKDRNVVVNKGKDLEESAKFLDINDRLQKSVLENGKKQIQGILEREKDLEEKIEELQKHKILLETELENKQKKD